MRSLLVCALFALVGCSDPAPTEEEEGGACVWNMAPDGTVMNGHYEEAGTFNDVPYYSKSVPTTDDNACEVSLLYIYMSNATWRIGPDLGSNITALAFCDSASFLDSPFDCAGDWRVDEIGLDADAVVSEGACPEWVCSSILATYAMVQDCNACCGTFTASAQGSNVYERQEGLDTYYWYFNPLRFRWQCGDSLDADCDATTIDEASETGFPSIVIDQWIDVSASTPAGNIFFNCLGPE